MPDFDTWLTDALGADDAARLTSHADIPAWLRTNPQVTDRDTLRQALRDGYGIETEPHPGVPDALRVVGQPPVTPTGTLHHYAGHFVQQSLGSQIPPLLLDVQPGHEVLDLCAAPGSKTTQLVAALRGRGHVWANDVSGVRMVPLAARLDACSATNFITSRWPAERLPNLCDATFDRILADVPCTGIGRKEHVTIARDRFSSGDTPNTLPEIQYRLLLAACKMLRVGGRIVYSTCSLCPAENEAVVHQVVSRLPLRLVEPPTFDGLVLREGRTRIGHERLHPSLHLTRTLTPWDNPSPGFFVAVLEKTDALDPHRHGRTFGPDDTRRIPTLGADHPDVARILDNIGHFYGLDVAAPEILGRSRFVLKKRDALNVVDGDIDSVWHGIDRVGTTLARRRGALWRLSHGALQRFGEAITRNRVELPHDVLTTLAETGRADAPVPDDLPTPYPALVVPGFGPLASVHAEAGRWRWKRAQALTAPLAPSGSGVREPGSGVREPGSG